LGINDGIYAMIVIASNEVDESNHRNKLIVSNALTIMPQGSPISFHLLAYSDHMIARLTILHAAIDNAFSLTGRVFIPQQPTAQLQMSPWMPHYKSSILPNEPP
jgi:hypothetical protein